MPDTEFPQTRIPTHTDPSRVPLYVDLDGTLVKSDTLVDSLLSLLRNRPILAIRLPGMVLRGKAAFKAFLSDAVELDVAHLPYNRALMRYLQQQRAAGRKLYLATGADENLALRVSEHAGFFSGVFASDGKTNLTGGNKLERLREHAGGGEFGYVGNERVDLPLLAAAAAPMVVNPTPGLLAGMRSMGITPVESFVDQRSRLKLLLKAIRLHQWAKNLLIFVPLLLAHSLTAKGLLTTLVAFLCFGFAASATYIVNDLLDIEADRRHPRKHLRPFASGDLSAFTGVAILAVFMSAAFVGARFLSAGFFEWLLIYLVATLSYSLYLKRVALVDVLVLAGLYTIRLQAGGAATHTPISHWLAGFAIFLFFSLAIVKRFAELENQRASGASPKNGRGYRVADLEQLRSFGTASAFAAVVVFANYISGREVASLYRQPKMLWLIVPLLILWLSRVWLLTSRGELSEDPVVFALTDRVSLLIGAGVVVLAVLAL